MKLSRYLKALYGAAVAALGAALSALGVIWAVPNSSPAAGTKDAAGP